jgi:hypothetical protein
LRALTPRRPRRAERLAAPVALFDLLDLFLAEAEVVADLVDERLADDGAHVVLVLAVLLDRALEDGDAVGQPVAVGPLALGQRRALVEAVERIGRLDLHRLERLALGSSSTTMAMFRISSRKRRGMSVIASATRRLERGARHARAPCAALRLRGFLALGLAGFAPRDSRCSAA